MLTAIADSPPDAPKPTKIEQFVAAHPNVAAAERQHRHAKQLRRSGIFRHQRVCVRERRGRTAGGALSDVARRRRCIWPPPMQRRAPDFLSAELPERLKQGPVAFHLKAQLAAPGDDLVDPAKPWPADRKVVELGTLTIDKVVSDSATAQKALLFLPGQVTDGIEPSDDPMIGIRDGSYANPFRGAIRERAHADLMEPFGRGGRADLIAGTLRPDSQSSRDRLSRGSATVPRLSDDRCDPAAVRRVHRRSGMRLGGRRVLRVLDLCHAGSEGFAGGRRHQGDECHQQRCQEAFSHDPVVRHGAAVPGDDGRRALAGGSAGAGRHGPGDRADRWQRRLPGGRHSCHPGAECTAEQCPRRRHQCRRPR